MSLKTYLTGALALMPLFSLGQSNLTLSDNKTYLQVGPRTLLFEGGSLGTTIVDGEYSLAACVDNGSPFVVSPYLLCPLGTSGFITSGDVDGDGNRDDNLYYSIAQVRAALQIEPFQPQRIRMIAAPPSALARPIGGAGWQDNSIVIWFDQINFPVRAYELTRYSTSRNYLENELQLQYDEIEPGTYIFETPRLNDNLNPFPIRVTHVQMIEAWPGRGVVPTYNDFTLLNDNLWSKDGAIELDHRLFSEFLWRGFNGQTVRNGDVTDFHIINTSTVLRDGTNLLGGSVEDVVVPPGYIVFPPYNVLAQNPALEVAPVDPPAGLLADFPPELIATPSTNYQLGPGFFRAGDEARVNLRYRRNLISTANSADGSTRNFSWNIAFVDTFQGFMTDQLRLGIIPNTTPSALLEPNGDFDGDGSSNVEEFALQTDLTNPADVPVLSPTLDPLTKQYIFDVPKRANVGSLLQYNVQYSSDLQNYTTITDSDPDWFIEEDSDTNYRVRSREPSPITTGLLRVLITTAD